jgi:poly-gamma-glutamate synthesis protein (capsule biosynthesis protein)
VGAITIVATGDSIMSRRFVPYPDRPFSELIRIIRDADVAFTNVEIVLNSHAGVKDPWLAVAADAAIAGDIREMGFDLVSLANNHSMGFGIPGMLQTLSGLRSAGLAVAGAGRNLHEARRPAYAEVPAGRVALVAASSTFFSGEQATHQERHQSGRPGISPLRHEATYILDDRALEELARIKRIARLGGGRHGIVRRATQDEAGTVGDPLVLEFLGQRFVAGVDPGRVSSTLDAEDFVDITKWVREARHYADVVLVSLHCHEVGVESADYATPPDFLTAFAHGCIEAGADAFIGHGPHRLMGLEIYRGKPIFYSLANLFWQQEYVMQLPGENYLSPEMRDWTPHDWWSRNARQREIRSDQEMWDSIVPECVFDGHELRAIRLHPLTLGWGLPLPQRGTPRLAGDDGPRVLRHFAELSSRFGTRIDLKGSVGEVRLR